MREEHEKIASYMDRIEKLSERRNLLVHGVWFKDSDTGKVFRAKVRPDMLWRMFTEKSKFTKEEIREFGAEFTALRREFVPFANRYCGAKLEKMVAQQMAVAEALNPGSTVKLGRHAKAAAAEAVELEDTPARPAES
jgi:hypothetical protein